MSDSVTNVDVEDVLSSIRRLVSDTNSDARPAPEPEHAKPEAKPVDALLLTSALRVPSAPTAFEDASTEGARAADLSNLRGAIAEAGEQEDVKADWPAPTSDEYYEDDEPEDVNPVIDFIRHGRTTPAEQQADAQEETPEQADDVETSFNEQDNDDQDDWSPQLVDAEVADDSEGVDDMPFEFAEDLSAEDTNAPVPEWIEAGLAEISEAEIVEPDDSEAKETSERSEAEPEQDPEAIFASAAAASVFASDEDASADNVTTELGGFDEGVLDEEALRDLVAEIVRQELTGELGERITRNVRKLVRREIHRALLTREFE